jgi:aldehyde dehydrogenase (NAD+)
MPMPDAATIAVGDSSSANGGPQPAADRRLLIDGQLVTTGGVFASVNPATREVIGHAPEAGIDEAQQAIAAARRAFDTTTWSTDTPFRVRCLEQLHQALLDHAEELRELTIAEVGATRALTQGAQLDEPIKIVRYYADLLRDYPMTEDLGEIESRGMRHRRWVEKEAAGVVGAIIAYNYPNQLALAKLPPALAAGCTVILKGAPDTPLVTLALGELIANHTDIPPGVTVKRVFLELGGKSAAILLDDADFAGASVFAAFSMVTHAGQGCALTSRLLVPRKHHDEIVELVAQNFAKVRHGDPADPKTYMGPLINERQRDKVDGMVQRAVADGATLVTGGKRLDPGYFYAPTLLTNVDPDSEIAQQEIFGPVLAVIAFDDDDDAVRIANNSIYGLAGAVFSADQDRALAVARRIRAGSFSVNGGNYFSADAPFGGFKQSGVGREMGVAGLEEFLERKTIAVPAAATAGSA